MDYLKSKNQLDDWQVVKESIRERGRYLLDSALWADCKFLVGTDDASARLFEAHKLILSMTSPVFATMFHGGLPETQSTIKIVDVQPEAFRSMLEYIYTDTMNMDSLDHACELCYVAKKYMLPHLLKNCMEYIWRDVDCDTALRAYEFAKLFDDAEIADRSMQIVRENTVLVLSKTGALNMSVQTLLDILDQDQLNITLESYLFKIIQSWVMSNINRTDGETYDTDKVRAFARPLLQKIRFLSMDPSDFADGPAQSHLLTKDEALAILLNLSSPHKKYPMPDGFSMNKLPRKNPSQKLVCLSRKSYVHRPMEERSVQLSNGCLTDELFFKTSDDITLLGIQIPSQIMHVFGSSSEDLIDLHQQSVEGNDDSDHSQHSSSSLGSIPKSKYRELLITFVKEVNNPRNNCFTHFKSLVEHNSILDIMFTSPAKIKRGQEYELTVTLHKEGYYLVGSVNRTSDVYSDGNSDGIQFTLAADGSALANRFCGSDGFIFGCQLWKCFDSQRALVIL